jgi:2-oxoglutarate dehydrogenase complex dehydrogenase (E1) component-like enzyme
VMTPKSLLRHPRCVSTLSDLADGQFAPVLDDAAMDPGPVRRVCLVSGKLYYELAKARDDKRAGHVALVRLEQLYPFPGARLAQILSRYSTSAEIAFCQEEPRNMGTWRFVREHFLDGDVPGFEARVPRYIGREASASPAPGSYKTHQAEQDAILQHALA